MLPRLGSTGATQPKYERRVSHMAQSGGQASGYRQLGRLHLELDGEG